MSSPMCTGCDAVVEGPGRLPAKECPVHGADQPVKLWNIGDQHECLLRADRHVATHDCAAYALRIQDSKYAFPPMEFADANEEERVKRYRAARVDTMEGSWEDLSLLQVWEWVLRYRGANKAPGGYVMETAPEVDMVAHPPHYMSSPSGVECIQVTEHLNFCIGNAIKYLWRTDDKGDALENLRKARWYVDREIARRGGGT